MEEQYQVLLLSLCREGVFTRCLRPLPGGGEEMICWIRVIDLSCLQEAPQILTI